jgi:hypothetical protein
LRVGVATLYKVGVIHISMWMESVCAGTVAESLKTKPFTAIAAYKGGYREVLKITEDK